jgi:CheY-like chemotaxis protein
VNLATNAQQALRDTTTSRRLTLTTRSDPTHSLVTLEVADTGPGIAPEVQERVFEPFFTTKASDIGTGLGLPLCQGIIKSHGGTISVTSQPGQGTVFRVALPVEAVPVPLALLSEAPPTPPVQAKTLLVVDDESSIAKAIAALLRRDRHQVDTAANGRLALAKLQERTYDLILCDLRMPDLDGPGLYHELEAQAPHLLRRFIFLTGDTLSPEGEAFLKQVGVPSLIKPCRGEEVRQVVRQALQALQAEASCCEGTGHESLPAAGTEAV